MLSAKKKNLHHSKACIPTRNFKAQEKKKAQKNEPQINYYNT